MMSLGGFWIVLQIGMFFLIALKHSSWLF